MSPAPETERMPLSLLPERFWRCRAWRCSLVSPFLDGLQAQKKLCWLCGYCLAMAATSVTAGCQAEALQLPQLELGVRLAAVRPLMTAVAEDPAWATATSTGELTLSPGKSAKRTTAPSTRVFLLWSPDFLYVRFVCRDDDLYSPHEATHDAWHHEGDVVEVFVDPVGDSRQWYEIQVSPAGGVMDKVAIVTAEPKSRPDGVLDDDSFRQMWDFPEYDMAGLKTATGQTPGGWIADIAIPAAALCRRMEAKSLQPMSMRANFLRYERRQQPNGGATLIAMNWAPVLWGHPHCSPQRMGVLRLVQASTASEMELRK
ncbi:MAG: carbohydrate-binding family 9-like protein [Phycisphaeraceae bacterium]